MDDISACYRILDLEPGASLEDVKRSYRELVRVWHPDRFRSDPKLQTKAEEKLKRINLAYERLSKEAASAERKAASSQPPRPEPERTRPEPRPPQTQSAKGTQAHTDRAHPRSATTSDRIAERFFRWIRQPRDSSTFVAFVIALVGVVMIALLIVDKPQSAGRKSADVATTPVPKIANVPIEKNEKLVQLLKLLKAASQGDTSAQTALSLAFEQYQKDAASGDANAQSYLGLMYAEGAGVPKDEVKAVEWYQKAVAQGNVYAQLNLGLMYDQGRGVPKNVTKAAEWYQKAAAQGNGAAQKLAQSMLGLMYAEGVGVPKDEAKAIEWHQKAAAQGDTGSQFHLGLAYENGRGIEKDEVKAAHWYQKAAAQGNVEAGRMLTAMYANGRGIPKNAADAFEWHQKAAAQGSASAQNRLGLIYYNRSSVKDYAKALEWFQKAAVQGYSEAQYNLGVMYANGAGVPKDSGKAVEWYKKSATQGNESAISTLERLYNYSAPKDGTKPSAFARPMAPPTGSTQKPDDALLRHLNSDDRLVSGSLLVDRLRNYAGKGKLTLDNGLAEDAYVKFILNGKLVAAFYVRSHEKFTYSTIPDGSYSVIYCTGYGWDGAVRNFARGRHARRYDNPLNYSTRQARDGSGVTTYTDVATLTLHKVIGGNAKASDMSLEDFDQY